VAEKHKKPVDLEKALAELEGIVEQLEGGELSLDQSLKQFETGIALSRECQATLEAAQQKVQVLLDGDLKDADPENLAD